MYPEYFIPKTICFVEITELDLLWCRDHGAGSNDLDTANTQYTWQICHVAIEK